MSDGRHRAPRGRSARSEEARQRALANEQRLRALGAAVDEKSGIVRKPHAHLVPSRRRRRVVISSVVVVGLLVTLVGGGYLYALWRWSQIPKVVVPTLKYPVSGKPFNILTIGSDSRAGRTGTQASQTGTSAQVSGQRSDVVKIVHVDPTNDTVTILSIPRDTTVTLLANTGLYGTYNRINVNYRSGPSLLAQTITANFGIVINHVVQVGFAGLINSALAIGGVYLDFPYKAHDPVSGLNMTHPGCQLVTGAQALAVARSRHYYYSLHGRAWPPGYAKDSYSTFAALLASRGWVYDGTSDYGRIDRQNSFLRSMLNRVKGSLGNPLKMNNFLSNLPRGVTIDSTWSLNEMIGYALKFRNFSSSAIKTYTLPTIGATVNGQDLLFVNQPYTQQLLVNIFGSSLLPPTNPPPNDKLQPVMPPVIAPTTSTTVAPTTTTKKHGHRPPVTTTTNPTLAVQSYDPVPCAPK